MTTSDVLIAQAKGGSVDAAAMLIANARSSKKYPSNAAIRDALLMEKIPATVIELAFSRDSLLTRVGWLPFAAAGLLLILLVRR